VNLKISSREKVLLVVAFLCVVFFLYWQLMLNPMLKSIDKTRAEIKAIRLQLEYSALPPLRSALTKEKDIKIYSKEKQLNFVMKFIDSKFRWFGIKLISLRQTSEKKKLTIDLKFKSSSYQLLGFLNSLSQLKTVLVIDKVVVKQEADKLVTEMKLLSAYK